MGSSDDYAGRHLKKKNRNTPGDVYIETFTGKAFSTAIMSDSSR